jgi:hypothetical protein
MTSRYLLIQSGDRIQTPNSSPSSFSLRLNRPISGSFRLRSAVVPLSYYNITASNNTLNFIDNGTARVITVTPGFYNINTLSAALQAAIQAVSPQVWTVTFSTITGRMSFQSSAAFTLKFSIITNSIGSSIGFATSDYASVANVVTAPNIATLQTLLHLRIHVTGAADQFESTTGASNCTLLIPVTGSLGSTVEVYEPQWHQHLSFYDSQGSLTITVTDSNNNIVPLQADWVLVLEQV